MAATVHLPSEFTVTRLMGSRVNHRTRTVKLSRTKDYESPTKTVRKRMLGVITTPMTRAW